MAEPSPPAFPSSTEQFQYGCEGMSLRDYFASKALSGFTTDLGDRAWQEQHFDSAAVFCYRMADAMLRERARKEPSDG